MSSIPTSADLRLEFQEFQELTTRPEPLALLVTAVLGERELGRRRAAGWPDPEAPQQAVRGGRLLYFTDPGSPFDLRPRWLSRGLRILSGHPLPGALDGPLPLPPLWVYRLALPKGDLFLVEMAAACLDELELEAVRAGTMPRYLRP